MKQFSKDFINKVRSRQKSKAEGGAAPSTPGSSSTPISTTFPRLGQESSTLAAGSESSTTTFAKTPVDDEDGVVSPMVASGGEEDLEDGNETKKVGSVVGTRRSADVLDEGGIGDVRDAKRGKLMDQQETSNGLAAFDSPT